MVDIVYQFSGVRDRPVTNRLINVLKRAAADAGIDRIVIYSGGQPGTTGQRTGSPRHDAGNAADLRLYVGGVIQRFTDQSAPQTITDFVTAASRYGATGMGAAEGYMGPTSLHVGFGTPRTVWGRNGKRRNAPAWLVGAFDAGQKILVTPTKEFIVVARGGAQLKRGPGNEFETLLTVPSDTVIAVIALDGAKEDWARVDLVGDGYVDGHVHVAFIRPLAEADAFIDLDDMEFETEHQTGEGEAPNKRKTSAKSK